MKFNKILPPYKFKEYWSKYPLGQTIYQAILDWAEMFNELITDHNVMSDQWDGFQSQIDGKADLVHTHSISEVTDLQKALDSKVDETTTVNSKALSTNITINASDVPNTPAGNISATNVQNALNELDTEKANRVQENWITPTLLNGATNGDIPIRYRKNNMNQLEFEGELIFSSSTLAFMSLPQNYHKGIVFYRIPTLASDLSLGFVIIQANGLVYISTLLRNKTTVLNGLIVPLG